MTETTYNLLRDVDLAILSRAFPGAQLATSFRDTMLDGAVIGTVTVLRWLEGSSVPAPSQAEIEAVLDNAASYVPVPISVTPLQARKALNAAGIRAAVEAFFASPDRTQQEKDEWHYASEVRRADPVLTAAATSLGLTSEQIDQLFIAAGGM